MEPTPRNTPKIVVDLLREHGPLTTPEIVILAKRKRSTVAAVLMRLLRARVVRRSGAEPTRTRGRPRVIYSLLPSERKDIGSE